VYAGRRAGSILADDPDEDAEDVDPVAEDGLHGLVGRLEADPVAFLEEALQGGLAVVVADGDGIVREGDVGHDMFIVQSGRVRISKRKAHGEVVLATLGRGDFFGEMSLLESLPREATARAVGETRLLVLSRGGLLIRLRRDPT